MSRPLSPSERTLRMNIRNAFLAATLEEIENEIERRLDKERFLDVRFLKELKAEIEAENRLHPHQYEAFATFKNLGSTVSIEVPVGLGKHYQMSDN